MVHIWAYVTVQCRLLPQITLYIDRNTEKTTVAKNWTGRSIITHNNAICHEEDQSTQYVDSNGGCGHWLDRLVPAAAKETAVGWKDNAKGTSHRQNNQKGKESFPGGTKMKF